MQNKCVVQEPKKAVVVDEQDLMKRQLRKIFHDTNLTAKNRKENDSPRSPVSNKSNRSQNRSTSRHPFFGSTGSVAPSKNATMYSNDARIPEERQASKTNSPHNDKEYKTEHEVKVLAERNKSISIMRDLIGSTA